MSHLVATEAFARLSEQAGRLQRLQNLLEGFLPAYLQPGTRVANLKRGKLVIHTDSGAVAVKLRQLTPRLAESYNQQGHEVTGIEVRVQAWRPTRAKLAGKIPKVLGIRQKQALTSLAQGLTPGSALKTAVEKLLKGCA